MVFGGKFRIRRSNSKASYLPRQSHEKLASDPDHGSYKLTLNSNEDCIHLPNFNGQLHATKINNLPDVLPLGVKIKGVSTTRYGSNTVLNDVKPHNDIPGHLLANGKSAHMMNANTKYISQSTIDLKRAHRVFNGMANGTARIANTESMGNLLECSKRRQSSPPNPQQKLASIEQLKQMRVSSDDLSIAQHNAINMNGLMPSNGKAKVSQCNNIMDSLLVATPHDTAKISQLHAKFTSSAHINHASLVEIEDDGNDADAFNDNNSTDDASSMSQLSSESMSSVDSTDEPEPSQQQQQPPQPQQQLQQNQPSPPAPPPPPKLNNSSEKIDQLIYDLASSTLNTSTETTTSEVGSQTDETILDDLGRQMAVNDDDDHAINIANANSTTHCADDFGCKQLTESLVEQLAPNDRLRNVLAPKVYKSTSDYLSGLYNPQIASRCYKKDAGTSMHREQCQDLTENPSMYRIVAGDVPFAKPLNGTRFGREMQLISSDVCDLTKQKEELVMRLTNFLVALANDRAMITDQSTANDLLGTDVSNVVAQKVRPGDASKYRSHVDDVGHITMLLLSLSGRLARVENSLSNIVDTTEKKLLETKRTKLVEQLDEAKRLKVDIDRRGKNIAQILEKCLSCDEYADYDYFINSKAKLIVDLRDVADRIELNEDKMNALKETLTHSEC